METVEAVLARQLTQGDFYAIESETIKGAKGGKQSYIDIPLEGIGPEGISAFANGIPKVPWPSFELPSPVKVLGQPNVEEVLTLGPRENNKRYKIDIQARRKKDGKRHPAWTAERGFPEIPDSIIKSVTSSKDPNIPDVSGIKVLLIKTYEGNYYASFVDSKVMPITWPQGFGFEKIFKSGFSALMLNFPAPAPTLSDAATKIIDVWRGGKKNVLLYGPPGTGKTHLMQELWSYFSQNGTGSAVMVDPSQPATTAFSTVSVPSFDGPIRCDWVTFHQNFSYENFILALRPEPKGGVMTLKPRAGVMLDAAISLSLGEAKTVFLFIDEVNRGNVSRIFGEFITFMDDDYRAKGGTGALPVPLGTARASGGKTEPIERMQGGDVELTLPWLFPNEVYVLASMNSVDRAVAPLDTALARRFARVEILPDMDAIADTLGIPNASLLLSLPATEEENEAEEGIEDTSEEDATSNPAIPQDAAHVAFLLLYRINYILATTLGPDFEIGHTYLLPVAKATDEIGKWRALARVWDQALYPQLRERYSSRPEILDGILRPIRTGLIRPRQRPAVNLPPAASRPFTQVPNLEEKATVDNGTHLEEVKKSLKRLAGL